MSLNEDELDRIAAKVWARRPIEKPIEVEKPIVVPPAAPEKEKHFAREYEKYCPECGTENTEYKAPDIRCKDCKSPLGREENAAKISKCWNCGGTNAERINK